MRVHLTITAAEEQ